VCEILRRRNNLNRTFAGAKPDTSHFAHFEVRNWTFRISHISQVRNRTLRSFAGATRARHWIDDDRAMIERAPGARRRVSQVPLSRRCDAKQDFIFKATYAQTCSRLLSSPLCLRGGCFLRGKTIGRKSLEVEVLFESGGMCTLFRAHRQVAKFFEPFLLHRVVPSVDSILQFLQWRRPHLLFRLLQLREDGVKVLSGLVAFRISRFSRWAGHGFAQQLRSRYEALAFP
jgi:hypothetical protein